MKKIIVILMAAALMSSCVSQRRSKCPTYAVQYKNLNKGTFGVADTDMYYHPGDIVCQLPDKTKFLIIDVKKN